MSIIYWWYTNIWKWTIFRPPPNHLKAYLGSVHFKGFIIWSVHISTKNPANRVQPPEKDQLWKHKQLTVQREKCSLSKASNSTLDPQDPDTCGASATTEPKQLGTDYLPSFFEKKVNFKWWTFNLNLPHCVQFQWSFSITKAQTLNAFTMSVISNEWTAVILYRCFRQLSHLEGLP